MLNFTKQMSLDFNLSSYLKVLYCSHITPIVEYGSILWDPYTASDLTRLERVQSKVLSFVSFSQKIEHQPHDYSPVLCHLRYV